MRANGKMIKWMDMENCSILMEKLHTKDIGFRMNLMVLVESITKFRTHKQVICLLITLISAILKTSGFISKENLKMI